MTVTISGNGLEDILDAIDTLMTKEVLVGIPHGEARPDSEMTNAQIGYIQETGSPAMNLPPRPFLAPGVELIQDKVALHLTKAIDAALARKPAVVLTNLNRAGMVAQNSVRLYFVGGNFAPLSEATIRQRLAKGRTGTNPLIDTQQLRKSVTYVIKKVDE